MNGMTWGLLQFGDVFMPRMYTTDEENHFWASGLALPFKRGITALPTVWAQCQRRGAVIGQLLIQWLV